MPKGIKTAPPQQTSLAEMWGKKKDGASKVDERKENVMAVDSAQEGN